MTYKKEFDMEIVNFVRSDLKNKNIVTQTSKKFQVSKSKVYYLILKAGIKLENNNLGRPRIPSNSGSKDGFFNESDYKGII